MRIYARDQVCGFRLARAAWGAFSNFQPLAVPIAAGPRRSPRPRRLSRVRQLHEQGFGVFFVRRSLRLAKLAPPQVECAQRQSVRRAEITASLTLPLEPLDQLPPLRGGAPRPTSRTTCPIHDSARLRVVGSGE